MIVVTANIDDSGGSTRYDAYGNATVISGAGDLHGYTGSIIDPETGLQYHDHRYYDATIGIWYSTDPIGFASGDYNLHRYVHNDPTDYTDPSGLIKFSRNENPTRVRCKS